MHTSMAARRLLHAGVCRTLMLVLPVCSSLNFHEVLPSDRSAHREGAAATTETPEAVSPWDVPDFEDFATAWGDQQSGSNGEFEEARTRRESSGDPDPTTRKILVDANFGFEQFDDVRYYRAFESLCAQYPRSEFGLIRIASDVSAMGLQYGDSLPENILQKYTAMGYGGGFGAVRTYVFNGGRPLKDLGMNESTPGALWRSKYGVELAKKIPGAYEYAGSPEDTDATARLAVRLIALRRAASAICDVHGVRPDCAEAEGAILFSDLTVLLKKNVDAGCWSAETNSTARALQGPALWRVDKVEVLDCALRAFDGAASRGRRVPDPLGLGECFKVANLPPELGVAALRAEQGALDEVRRAARDNARNKQFVDLWKKSSAMRREDNPMVNPSGCSPPAETKAGTHQQRCATRAGCNPPTQAKAGRVMP